MKHRIEESELYSDPELIGKVQCLACGYIDNETAYWEAAEELIEAVRPGRPFKHLPQRVCPTCGDRYRFRRFAEEDYLSDD